MQKHRLLEQALPSLFPFSLPPPPPLFAPATQARKKRIPTGIFFVIQSHTIYDVYHIVVIVHFHQLRTVLPYRGKTHLTNAQSKRSSRSDRSIQAKAEKVKSVNKTGISADQFMIVMNVTSNLSDLIPLSK